jgi:hypothetical protein
MTLLPERSFTKATAELGVVAPVSWHDLWYNQTALNVLEMPTQLIAGRSSVARMGRDNHKGGSR